MNAALPSAPDETTTKDFIALIDRFSEWHVLILQMCHDPKPIAERVGYQPAISSSLSAFVEKAYPPLRGNRALYDRIWADLNAAGLINTPGMHTMMSVGGATQKRTTPLGDRFLAFIRDPFEERE